MASQALSIVKLKNDRSGPPNPTVIKFRVMGNCKYFKKCPLRRDDSFTCHDRDEAEQYCGKYNDLNQQS